MASLIGDGNVDDAVKMSEEGRGGVFGQIADSDIADNGSKGIVLEEADGGDLEGEIVSSDLTGNDDGGTDIEAVQEDERRRTPLRDTTYTGEVEVEGVDLVEE